MSDGQFDKVRMTIRTGRLNPPYNANASALHRNYSFIDFLLGQDTTVSVKMTTLRPFRCTDMFSFNNVYVVKCISFEFTTSAIQKRLYICRNHFCRNLDPLTETYGLAFYMQYLARWPEYFQVAESPSGEIMGYSRFYRVSVQFIYRS